MILLLWLTTRARSLGTIDARRGSRPHADHFCWRSLRSLKARPLMVMFYLILIGLWLVNHWIAQRNLNAQSSQSALLHAKLSPAYETQRFNVLQLHS